MTGRSSWKRVRFLGPLMLALACLPGLAQHRLDAESSSISFATVKNGVITESHRFREISGTVGTTTEVSVRLDSVDTGIPIRDSRMAELLFDTAQFATAIVRAEVGENQVADLAVGQTRSESIAFELTLHGEEARFSVPVQITRLDEASILVASERPVVVSAASFGLLAGVERLREIAGLQAITPTVPVSFHLRFEQVP